MRTVRYQTGPHADFAKAPGQRSVEKVSRELDNGYADLKLFTVNQSFPDLYDRVKLFDGIDPIRTSMAVIICGPGGEDETVLECQIGARFFNLLCGVYRLSRMQMGGIHVVQ